MLTDLCSTFLLSWCPSNFCGSEILKCMELLSVASRKCRNSLS